MLCACADLAKYHNVYSLFVLNVKLSICLGEEIQYDIRLLLSGVWPCLFYFNVKIYILWAGESYNNIQISISTLQQV